MGNGHGDDCFIFEPFHLTDDHVLIASGQKTTLTLQPGANRRQRVSEFVCEGGEKLILTQINFAQGLGRALEVCYVLK
jgi:hypothetical protein